MTDITKIAEALRDVLNTCEIDDGTTGVVSRAFAELTTYDAARTTAPAADAVQAGEPKVDPLSALIASGAEHSTFPCGLIKFSEPTSALSRLSKRLRAGGIATAVAGQFADAIDSLLARREAYPLAAPSTQAGVRATPPDAPASPSVEGLAETAKQALSEFAYVRVERYLGDACAVIPDPKVNTAQGLAIQTRHHAAIDRLAALASRERAPSDAQSLMEWLNENPDRVGYWHGYGDYPDGWRSHGPGLGGPVLHASVWDAIRHAQGEAPASRTPAPSVEGLAAEAGTMIAGTTDESTPGGSIKVTRIHLTEAGKAATTEAANAEEARRGFTWRDGAKHYCCYGMYSDVGHSQECKHYLAARSTQGDA